MKKKISIILSLIILTSCISDLVIYGKGDINLERVDFTQLDNWNKDNHSPALSAFLNSCNKFSTMPDSRNIGGQIGHITVQDFRDVCEIGQVIKGMGSKQAKNFFENWFIPFKVTNKKGEEYGKFTGYYIPTLNGSKEKTEKYQYPIYSKPKNIDNNPYYTRAEITKGALRNQDLEIIYVDDKVDLFFMHIQGSGNVMIEDGVIIRLSYAGSNNQPFYSIGKYMIEHDLISDKSYFGIKKWLKENPKKADKILNINLSYIFFKENHDNNVIGGANVPLMTERSIAIDKDILPYGYPFWVEVEDYELGEYQKLLISQDTGSAIKGTIRADIFFGSNEDSEKKAANMNNEGKYYILLPINLVDKFSSIQ
ncbi:MltA domain-containing protein [Rickettsiales bacterium]|nr:MltA domain-containing protein [Rickettsiales bacterium]